MMVFWDARLVLLAVPKTGTMALHGALGRHASIIWRDPPELKHATLARVRREVLPMVEARTGARFETMAILREPEAWVGSWFRYRSRPERDGHPNSTKGLSFERFVAEVCADDPPPRARIGRQATYAADGTGSTDHLFRHEHFDHALAFLSQRLGVEVSVNRVNVSPPGDLTLSATGRTQLAARLAADAAAWRDAL